jgi:prepilin-type N-terminal cleavage/methylation domain-containing protein
VVRRGAQRGYTMMEVVVTLAVFGVFLFIIVILTAEMKSQEKRFPVNFLSHPDTSSVIARLRRDVYDAKYVARGYQKYERSSKVVILYCIREGTGETVVYDFSTKGDAHRMTFSTETMTSDWVAHAVPDFTVQSCVDDDCPNEISSTGQTPTVHVTATDDKGRTAIDQILFKRTTI